VTLDPTALLEGIDPVQHPNAWALAMSYLDDFAKLGPEEAERRQMVLRARTDIIPYAKLVYEIEPAAHHSAIIEFLQDETIKRGLIIAPPGSAKSTWVSGVYASHYFSRNVDHSVLLVSNTSEQVVKWTASVRDIVEGSPEYQEIFPEIVKDEEKGWTRQELYLANRQDRANVSPNLVGYGIGGPILGRRANIIIVDDPTSQTQSRSAPVMNEQKDWFKATLMSRLIPGGRVIVVLTRWNEDDLASMLINQMDFQVLQMPALGDAEKGAFADYILPQVYDEEGENDTEAYLEALDVEKAKHEANGFECEIVRSNSVNRHCVRKYFGYEGENKQSIWPNRFSVAEYARVRRDYGSSYFRLVYDGDTSGSSGDIIKSEWFRYWGPNVTTTYEGDDTPVQELPLDCQWYQFVDVATGTKAENDYFVVMTVAVDSRGRVFVVNVERRKLEAPDQPKLIQQQFNRYPLTQWVLIETVGYQLSLFQNLQRQSMIPLKKYQPIKDKVARAKSMAAIFEAGRIYFLQGAKWLDDFEYELTVFPKGKHDDQLDALSSGMEELSGALMRQPKVIQVGFG
jgi:predicted phage terminase large subunit-like protein